MKEGRKQSQSDYVLMKGNFIMSSFPSVLFVNKLHSGVLVICLKPPLIV